MEMHTLASWDTELSADSVEWCPYPDLHHMFVCGTYQLTESEKDGPVATRKGRIYLLALGYGSEIVKHLQSIEVAAVLDCKWAPQLIKGKALLGVATAAGQLILYTLNSENGSSNPQLKEQVKISLPNKEQNVDLLALSLDWSTRGDDIKVAVSDSKGHVSVIQLDDGLGLHVEHTWTAHEYEAWTVHFDFFSPNVCYTGGDDCKMRVFDTRADLSSAVLVNSAHDAGVTAFWSSRTAEHRLLSGSYDEQVRLWDTRQLKSPLCSAATGGGVWRLRYSPQSETHVLAACMYNGIRVLDSNLNCVTHYTEHESIAYGADWSHLTSTQRFLALQETNGQLIATCSFYDHKLCLSVLS